MTIEVRGVHHIMVTVGDIEISKNFYGKILGLEEIDCPVKDGQRVWYKLGNQELHVNLHKNHRSGFSHFALSVTPEKYEEYYRLVKSTGYDKVNESRFYEADGTNKFFVDDPFGNTIEIMDGQISA